MQIAGKLYVVAAPSGAGKTSLVKALVEKSANLSVAVSHTTRPQRPYEKDHVNYHFVTEEEFAEMLEKHEFLEHATVFNHRYGTSWAAIHALLDVGSNIILEIDWQGAEQIRQVVTDCISIFILPPSLQALKMRLENRAQDDPDVISRRMNAAINELSHYSDFDYLVVNDQFDTALEDLKAVIQGDGSPYSLQNQQQNLKLLLSDLLQTSPKNV
jgi:guanylate kinase